MAKEKNPDPDDDVPKGFVTTFSQENVNERLTLYTPSQGEPLKIYGFTCDFNVAHTIEMDDVRKVPAHTHRLSFEFSFDEGANREKTEAVRQVMGRLAAKIAADYPDAECTQNKLARTIHVNFNQVATPLRFISEFYTKYYKQIAKDSAEGKIPLGSIHTPREEFTDVGDPPIVPGEKSVLFPNNIPFQRRILPLGPKQRYLEDDMSIVARGVTDLTHKFFPEGKPPTQSRHNLFRSELCREPKSGHPEWKSIANLNYDNQRLELVTKTAKAWFPVTPKPLTEEEKAAQVPPRTEASPVTPRQRELFEKFLYDALVEPPKRRR